MKRMHIIGRKNSGKTTLIEELVRCLTELGLRVGTVKHTHHRHELDVPGKDSHRHRQAGAATVAILSPNMNAVFWQSASVHSDAEKYAELAAHFDHCDLVLVEGNSGTTGPKIEVWRQATNTEPIAASDPSILALVTDDPSPVHAVPVWPRHPVGQLIKQILNVLEIRVGN